MRNLTQTPSLPQEVQKAYGSLLSRRAFTPRRNIFRRLLYPFESAVTFESPEMRIHFAREMGCTTSFLGPPRDRRLLPTPYVLAYANAGEWPNVLGSVVEDFGPSEAAALDNLYDKVAHCLRGPTETEWERIRQFMWSQFKLTPVEVSFDQGRVHVRPK